MIVFRTDGNASIGLGHVMRCVSIANAFRSVTESCLFIISDRSSEDQIRRYCHETYVLKTAFNQMDLELNELSRVLCDSKNVKAVVVDSYFVTKYYLRKLQSTCSENKIVLVYIDDVFSFPYPCDLLLNYNINTRLDSYITLYKEISLPDIMIGTMYTPLREEFQLLADRKTRKTGKSILISTGGTDFEHIGIEIIRSIISREEWNDYQFHFIIGVLNKDRYEIERIVSECGNVEIHCNVKEMSKLMCSSDVAISAAGSTLYELCATQTPMVTYILSDNQIFGAQCFANEGVAECVGDIRKSGAPALATIALEKAIKLVENYDARKSMSHKMKYVVDGKGAERIVDKVLEKCSYIN